MNVQEMWAVFQAKGFDFFTGVPDSTFKSWMSFLDDMHGQGLQNIIACNECEAVAIGTGYHLATRKTAVIYMQNSGLGKTVNPLTSLADPQCYSIPLLLLIGWRGEPGKKDEPQHRKMGEITLSLLDTLGIPYTILPDNSTDFERVLGEAHAYMREKNAAYAIIVKKKTLEPYKNTKSKSSSLPLSREDTIKTILTHLQGDEVIVSTTGKTSRELFETRVARNQTTHDFYTVGSMGCSASIALGIALNSPKKALVLDGDGALLMQLGSLSTVGYYHPHNFYHIVIDNQSYESTGGQPTVSKTVNFEEMSHAAGYTYVHTVADSTALESILPTFFQQTGPAMLIIHVKKGARADLGRPTSTPKENKAMFMNFLQK
ncbi:MAG: phosphonopyruvate decarboxylase [Promethearchaeota archaeon]